MNPNHNRRRGDVEPDYLRPLLVVLILSLLAFATSRADAVYVGADASPSYPGEYRLADAAAVASTDIVSRCPGAIAGRKDMGLCTARQWVARSAIAPTDMIGICYGGTSSTPILNCDIANGGGEGWQLASAIWTTTPIPPGPPVFTGTATLTCTPPTQNTDGSALTNLTGYHWVYGAASPPAMPLATTTACSYIANNLTVGTWYFAVTAYTPTSESALSNITSKTITAPSTCGPKPADKTNACPAGTTGSWTQTYVAAPYPTCWTATPTSAPAGSCVTNPVTSLKSIGGDVFSASPDYALWDRWKTGAKAGTVTPNQKCEPARSIKGTDLYRVSTGITWTAGQKTYVVARCALQ